MIKVLLLPLFFISFISNGQITSQTADEMGREVFEMFKEVESLSLSQWEENFMNLSDFKELAVDTSLGQKPREMLASITEEQYHNRYERALTRITERVAFVNADLSSLTFDHIETEEQSDDGMVGFIADLFMRSDELLYSVSFTAMLRNGGYELMIVDEFDYIRATDEENNIDETTVEIRTEQTNIIQFPDVEAQFPGGESALYYFVRDNLQYPQVAIENEISGKVYLRFIVEADGQLTNIEVGRGLDPSLDREAVRMLRSMPNWTPGKAKGKKVRTRVNFPVVFSLN